MAVLLSKIKTTILKRRPVYCTPSIVSYNQYYTYLFISYVPCPIGLYTNTVYTYTDTPSSVYIYIYIIYLVCIVYGIVNLRVCFLLSYYCTTKGWISYSANKLMIWNNRITLINEYNFLIWWNVGSLWSTHKGSSVSDASRMHTRQNKRLVFEVINLSFYRWMIYQQLDIDLEKRYCGPALEEFSDWQMWQCSMCI